MARVNSTSTQRHSLILGCTRWHSRGIQQLSGSPRLDEARSAVAHGARVVAPPQRRIGRLGLDRDDMRRAAAERETRERAEVGADIEDRVVGKVEGAWAKAGPVPAARGRSRPSES